MTNEYNNFSNGYRVGGSYSFTDMNIEPEKAFRKETGRPKNRFKLSLSNPNLFNNLGFSLAGRYNDSYFQNQGLMFGEGTIESKTIVDIQLTYLLENFQTSVKMGINNLFGESYTQSIGGPSIGQTVYLAMTFDKLLSLK